MRKLPLPQGFSLIEILIVILIVGLMTLVFANLPQSFQSVGSSSYLVASSQILSQKISDVRGLAYDNLTLGTSLVTDSNLAQIPGARETLTVEICPQPVCPVNLPAKLVTVELRWAENNQPRSAKVTTIVVTGGLP